VLFQNSRMGALFLITFLNMVGFGIIIPLLPYYATGFGAGPGIVGLLIGSYAAAQFLGSPVWGRLSDRYSRRAILLLTMAIGSLGYILFGLANSVILLFIGRIITGFMNGNISVIQAYLSDITTAQDRAKGYGILGAAFGLGLVSGPALGGLLSPWGTPMAVYTAASFNLLGVLAIYYFLPDPKPDEGMPKPQEAIVFNWSALKKALNRPYVGAILQTRFYFSLAFSTFATIFALYAEFGLHLPAQTTAWLLAYVGLLMVVVQGFMIGFVTRYLSEARLLFWSIVLMGFTLGSWAFITTVPLLLICFIPLALSAGLFNTVINSSISRIVNESEIGGILGVSAAVESATRIIAPSLGGYLLAEIGLWAPGLFSALILLGLIPYAYKHFIRAPHPELG